MSELAYKEKSQIEVELSASGYRLNTNFYFSDKETSTQGFVVGDREKIIVSFRGTQEVIKDWLSNLNFLHEDWTEANKLAEVHRGFNNAVNSIWSNVVHEVNLLRDNNQPVWLTGHSLGGALATIVAANYTLQEPSVEVAGIYTFGQPRAGDFTFAKIFNAVLKDKMFRMVNNNDVVTRLPPQVVGFSHVGSLMYIDSDGLVNPDSKLSWWGKFWDRLAGRFQLKSLMDMTPDGIADHGISHYVSAARKGVSSIG